MRAAAFLLLVILLPARLQAQRLFLGALRHPLDSEASAIAAADFNRDGRVDVALTRERGSAVSVLPGTGGVVLLGAPRDFLAGLGPVAIATGDVDLDGDADLVTANAGASTVTVLSGAGDGTFVKTGDFAVGRDPLAVELTDFDGDGVLDVLTTNFSSGDLTVLFGAAGGTFLPSTSVPVGDNPHDLAVADLDGDRATDIAVAHSGAMTCFRRGPERKPIRQLDFAVVPDPRVVRAGDLQADGLAEIVLVTDAGELRILENDGGWRFRSVEVGRVDSDRPVRGTLVLVDFDLDGALDVVTQAARTVDFSVRVHLGGAGRWTRTRDFYLDGRAAAVAFFDLDGDAALELAVCRADQPALDLVRGLDGGRLALREVAPLETEPRGVFPIDLDRDGRREIVVLSSQALEAVHYDAANLRVETIAELTGRSLRGSLAADLDGDGLEEIAATDTVGRSLVIGWLGSGGGLDRLRGFPLHILPSDLAAVDLDADGMIDIAAGDEVATDLRVVFHPGVDGPPAMIDVALASGQRAIAAGDSDGDAQADLAAATRNDVTVLLGDGRGGFPRRVEHGRFARAIDLTFASLGFDARSELCVLADDIVSIAGRTPADLPVEIALTGAKARRLAFHDVDGDGATDLLALGAGTLVARRGLGGLEFDVPQGYGIGASALDLATLDFDLNGAFDVATADLGSRTVSIVPGVREAPVLFRRGDVDRDGTPRLNDAVLILAHLFQGGTAPECPDGADADDDGVLLITDAVRLLAYLFQAGAAPPAPGPVDCGIDPTPDGLSCRGGCR